MKRIYAFDNLKALLIFCVVTGHLMEVCTTGKTQLPAYLVIYSFHMPLFLMVSGFFGKFHLKKLRKLLGFYVIFQFLYLFIVHVLFRGIPVGKISFSLTAPYWLLWYLLAMIYYTCLIPLLSRITGGWQAVFLLLCCVIGIAAGFFPSIGYYLSLSRFFCFLPFFVGGYFLGQRQNRLLESVLGLSPKGRAAVLSAGILAIGAAIVLCLTNPISAKMLYGSYPYFTGYGPCQRLLQYLMALLWSAGLISIFLVFLNRKVKFISFIGSHTLVIYLLHGFLIKAIAYL